MLDCRRGASDSDLDDRRLAWTSSAPAYGGTRYKRGPLTRPEGGGERPLPQTCTITKYRMAVKEEFSCYLDGKLRKHKTRIRALGILRVTGRLGGRLCRVIGPYERSLNKWVFYMNDHLEWDPPLLFSGDRQPREGEDDPPGLLEP